MKMGNLIEGIQEEQKRCRDLLALYKAIPPGFLGIAVIELALKNADKAIASGDAVEMLKSYNELKKIE